ncbi:heavy metal sensor histidine kinase [Neptunicella sp.]|uniref:heavy metal sensor histidine kinase n=1 Tax=Neptunicella sp. TaxID=2125986 RepID=UPI003F68D0C2
MTTKFSVTTPISLSSRVILLVGLTLVLSFILLGTVIDHSIQHHFAQQDANELAVVAQSVKNKLQTLHPDANTDEIHNALKQAVAGHHGVYFAIYSSQKQQLLYQLDQVDLSPLLLFPAQYRLSADELISWQSGQHAYRGGNLVGYMLDAHPVNVLVAGNMDFHIDFLERFRQTLWMIMSIVWCIAMIAAWWAVKLGHRPLLKVSRQIRDISTDNLHIRLKPEKIPDELQELVVSFNTMISHVEAGFKRLSYFSADIAHELRTPLTNLATQTQVALSRVRSVDEYKEILYSNQEEFDRLTKMVSDMLWLAKTDNGLIVPTLNEVNLHSEVHELFEYFDAWAEESQLTLELTGQATIKADRDMLRRALSNLLSNAIRYSAAQSVVRVSITINQSEAQIAVENNGETIPPEHISHLFDRFYRADQSRTRNGEGSGLGLAISKSIIDIHHGNLTVSSSQGRTIFTITLPLVRAGINHKQTQETARQC